MQDKAVSGVRTASLTVALCGYDLVVQLQIMVGAMRRWLQRGKVKCKRGHSPDRSVSSRSNKGASMKRKGG